MGRSLHRRFTDLSAIKAYLGSLPSGVNPVYPLYPLGGGGDDSSRIGHWGRNAAGVFVPFGEVLLSKVTTSQYGTAASAAGTTIELASAAAWTPASGTLRAWDSTGELGDSAYTRSGTTLTVTGAVATAVSAAIAAGRTVTMWDTATELSVGGATRDVRLAATDMQRFATGAVVTGRPKQAFAGSYRKGFRIKATIASYTALSAADKRVTCGFVVSGSVHSGYGFSMDAGASIRPAREQDGALTANATWSVVGSPTFVWVGVQFNTATQTGLLGGTSAENGGPHFNCLITDATYAGALPYLCADDGAVFSAIET